MTYDLLCNPASGDFAVVLTGTDIDIVDPRYSAQQCISENCCCVFISIGRTSCASPSMTSPRPSASRLSKLCPWQS